MNPIAPAPVEPRVFSPEETELLDRYLIASVGVVAARPAMQNGTEANIAASATRMCEALLKARATLLTGIQPDFFVAAGSSMGRGGAGVTVRPRASGAEQPGYAPQPRPQAPPPAYAPQGGGGQGSVSVRAHPPAAPPGDGGPSMVGGR